MGSLGMSTSSTVTAGGMSNMHPSLSVPLQAKDVGQHVCAALDRFTLVTQRPVQPHADLPASLILPEGTRRWRWLRITTEMATALGLGDLQMRLSQYSELPAPFGHTGGPDHPLNHESQ